ncbi:MOSC domain-containing protein [Ornithinicoccus hortensis]|uniref:MOSC domain-containing protein n=1 Tax=Ornithinicoccus hortensis TaxID=82346 RepID=A0A542YS46_9MICO|nr:MOSC N-terminal beta barrel domain-containing protein [Ornithinicoccus hortensis]TQL50922.1 hypothetical protein FB467_2042 [Ornithinicoccus hortensis]
MHLSAIHLHPVKSTAIRPVASATVGRAGLVGDREWMVVDTAGTLVSARELPALFRITADTPATDPAVGADLRLRAGGVPDLHLAAPGGRQVPVLLHRTALVATPAGAEGDAWVCRVTGRDGLRLVWCDDPTRRRLNPDWARPEDHTAFADSAPVSLASSTSLDRLNHWVRETAAQREEPAPGGLEMGRFRPNLVVDGVAEAFAEDGWRRIRVGSVEFRVPVRIDRCVMTTIDPTTRQGGKEPIRTLARHRREGGKTWFAMKLVPEVTGRIAVGDPVTVLEP